MNNNSSKKKQLSESSTGDTPKKFAWRIFLLTGDDGKAFFQ
ncbi:hypothetical protein ACLVWU_09905 [Bdellovibrio sp. HCB290]